MTALTRMNVQTYVDMERRTPRPAGGRRLTDRQAAILELVAAGKGNKEIAFDLGISEQAVKEHVSRLLQRFAVTNRAALGDAAATLRFFGTFSIDPDWLRFLFQHAPMHVAVVEGPLHRFVAVNDAYRVASGGRDLEGHEYDEIFPDRKESLALLDTVYKTGEPFAAAEIARKYTRAPGGPEEDGYLAVVLQPLPGPDGTTGGIAIFSIDTTDSVLARRRVRELEGGP
jgi:DNA-binding CsgD family transcriptional regulator